MVMPNASMLHVTISQKTRCCIFAFMKMYIFGLRRRGESIYSHSDNKLQYLMLKNPKFQAPN